MRLYLLVNATLFLVASFSWKKQPVAIMPEWQDIPTVAYIPISDLLAYSGERGTNRM